LGSPAKIPKRLKDSLAELAKCPVNLIHDANAWMMGAIGYQERRGIDTEFPAVLIALGTGVGVSVATGAEDIKDIELNDLPSKTWQELSEASHCKITESWHVHGIFGHPFFEWVEKEHKEWDYLRIRSEFTARVRAALIVMLPLMEKRLGRPIRSVVIAGGNAEYVSVPDLRTEGRTVVSLTESRIGLTPDLIPVLGAEISARKPGLETRL
jgi:hypothetical protein